MIKLIKSLNVNRLPPRDVFKRFVFSVSLFAAGAMLILLAESNIEPSIKQELVALLGLVLACLAGVYTFFLYLVLLFSRLRGK